MRGIIKGGGGMPLFLLPTKKKRNGNALGSLITPWFFDMDFHNDCLLDLVWVHYV